MSLDKKEKRKEVEKVRRRKRRRKKMKKEKEEEEGVCIPPCQMALWPRDSKQCFIILA